VHPSGALLAMASTPVSPPTPARPNRSAAPPAANGTISLIGLFGNG
jgi:hypothetical protein